MDKTVMVLTNSEQISRNRVGDSLKLKRIEDKNADMQKEQVAEEEVLQENEEEKEVRLQLLCGA